MASNIFTIECQKSREGRQLLIWRALPWFHLGRTHCAWWRRHYSACACLLVVATMSLDVGRNLLVVGSYHKEAVFGRSHNDITCKIGQNGHIITYAVKTNTLKKKLCGVNSENHVFPNILYLDCDSNIYLEETVSRTWGNDVTRVCQYNLRCLQYFNMLKKRFPISAFH